MNARAEKWLIEAIRDMVIYDKEIHKHNTYTVKIFTNPNSSKIPIEIKDAKGELISLTTLNIADEKDMKYGDFNTDGTTIKCKHTTKYILTGA